MERLCVSPVTAGQSRDAGEAQSDHEPVDAEAWREEDEETLLNFLTPGGDDEKLSKAETHRGQADGGSASGRTDASRGGAR